MTWPRHWTAREREQRRVTDHDGLHPETIAVVAGRPAHVGGNPLNQPITPASTFHFGEDVTVEYGRDGNPGWLALEAALGELEGGHCVTFSSGLAATTALLDELPPGTRAISQRAPYFGVANLMRQRAQLGLLQHQEHARLSVASLRPTIEGAGLVWMESPTNPMLDVVDLPAVIELAKSAGAMVVVDNTFATPFHQRPLAMGANVVLHSVTKLIGGHSDLVLGALVAADPAFADRLRKRRHDTGAIPGTLEAFLALRGLRTLPTRLARMSESAAVLAERLAAHPRIARVRYPGFGSMISFETTGSGDDAQRVCDAVRLVIQATSLGAVETTMERRARYPSEVAVDTPATLVRLSVGLEHVEDLWADLAQALDRA
jgi:cystathionine gamma-synthase